MSDQKKVSPLTKIPFISRILKFSSRNFHQLLRANHVTSSWEETVIHHGVGKQIFDSLDKSRDMMIQIFVGQIRDGLTKEQQYDMKEAIDHNPEKFIAAALAGLPMNVEKIFAIPIEDAVPFVDAALVELQGSGVPFFAHQLLDMAIHFGLDRLFKVLLFDFDAASSSRCDEYGIKSFYTAMLSEAIANRSEKIIKSCFLNIDSQKNPNPDLAEYQRFIFGDGEKEKCKILFDKAPRGEVSRKQFDVSAKSQTESAATAEQTPLWRAIFSSYPRTKPAEIQNVNDALASSSAVTGKPDFKCWFEVVHALLELKQPNGEYVIKLNLGEFKIFYTLVQKNDFITTRALLDKEPRFVTMLKAPYVPSNADSAGYAQRAKTYAEALYFRVLSDVGISPSFTWKDDKYSSDWKEGVAAEQFKTRANFVKLCLSLGAVPRNFFAPGTEYPLPPYLCLLPDLNYSDGKCMICNEAFGSGFFSDKGATNCSVCGICAHACCVKQKVTLKRPESEKKTFFGKLRSDTVEVSCCQPCYDILQKK
jgi:hypothetical protein